MTRRKSVAQRRQHKERLNAARNIIIVVVLVGILSAFYIKTLLSQKQLDPLTMCPAQLESVTVLLVDVTDPMNLPQQQDFENQFERLLNRVPRYGKLAIVKVDAVSDQLLSPVLERCNPGTASDASEVNGNPAKLQQMHEEQFVLPLREALFGVLEATGAPRSPILEAIQSVNLTHLQQGPAEGVDKTLVVASDLLQHTQGISFYRQIPEAGALIETQAFDRVRTDLRGVDVELWMLQRGDSSSTQPRRLPDLWDQLIDAQGGRLIRLYTVSG